MYIHCIPRKSNDYLHYFNKIISNGTSGFENIEYNSMNYSMKEICVLYSGAVSLKYGYIIINISPKVSLYENKMYLKIEE